MRNEPSVGRPIPPNKLQLLYFDGCPHYESFASHLGEFLSKLHIDAEVEHLRVESDAHAQRLKFLGSPTLRVGGHDVEPGADSRTDYGLQCRLYRTRVGLVGTPTDEWVLDAIQTAEREES